jgi:DNA-directed RNA polymerase specialized sigma24 family protein
LLPLDDQSTIVNFRELDLRLPDVTPLVQSILLLRFAGLKAKEVAFVLERPANTVNACMKKHAEALSRLFRESL